MLSNTACDDSANTTNSANEIENRNNLIPTINTRSYNLRKKNNRENALDTTKGETSTNSGGSVQNVVEPGSDSDLENNGSTVQTADDIGRKQRNGNLSQHMRSFQL